MVVSLSFQLVKNYFELVLRKPYNVAITGYAVRNKMATSFQSPAKLNSVVAFKAINSGKFQIIPSLVPVRDRNFTKQRGWEKEILKMSSQIRHVRFFSSLKEGLFICRMLY